MKRRRRKKRAHEASLACVCLCSPPFTSCLLVLPFYLASCGTEGDAGWFFTAEGRQPRQPRGREKLVLASAVALLLACPAQVLLLLWQPAP